MARSQGIFFWARCRSLSKAMSNTSSRVWRLPTLAIFFGQKAQEGTSKKTKLEHLYIPMTQPIICLLEPQQSRYMNPSSALDATQCFKELKATETCPGSCLKQLILRRNDILGTLSCPHCKGQAMNLPKSGQRT